MARDPRWKPIETSDLHLTMPEFAAKHNLDINSIYIKHGRHYYELVPSDDFVMPEQKEK